MFLRVICAAAVFVLLVMPMTVWSQDVQYGYDGYDRLGVQLWDFSVTPIPADFFGPGSDPFTGTLQLQGVPLLTTTACPSGLGNIDTIVQRMSTALLPTVGSSDVIPIEIVELSLTGIQPITVTYNGGLFPEDWTIDMTVSTLAASSGTMEITKTHANGGVYTMDLNVKPRFTFTRVSDSAMAILDEPATYNDNVAAANVPWVYNAPGFACPSCESNFVPANDGTQNVPFSMNGTQSTNNLAGGCSSTVIPTLSTWGLIILSIILMAAGAYYQVRRRRLCARA